MRILYTRDAETVAYAAEELKKYIVAMSGGEICPDICCIADASFAPDAILLATLSDLDLEKGERDERENGNVNILQKQGLKARL